MKKINTPLHSLVLLLCLVDVSTSSSLRVELTHVDASGKFTKHELIRRAARRSKARNAMLQRFVTAARVPAPIYYSEGEYLMDLSIGTPPQPFPAIFDTGSDLVWTQCKDCVRCVKQPVPLFDSSRSRTYSTLPCSSRYCRDGYLCQSNSCVFGMTYGDNSTTSGILAVDTLTYGSKTKGVIHNLVLGCGFLNEGTLSGSGIAGFGRLQVSLSSQLSLSKFSHCFTPLGSKKKSLLFLGSLADYASTNTSKLGRVHSTQFLKNPETHPTYYYVRLKGITVGAVRLPIPESAFALKADGTGGTIIDSGTTFTHLNAAVFEVLKKAFASHVKQPVMDYNSEIGFELCFTLAKHTVGAKVRVPKLVFHFDGADMDLPRDNYVITDDENGLLCLAVKSNDALGGGVSIIGNYQQQNMHVLYDLEHDMLSFAPAQCERLSKPNI